MPDTALLLHSHGMDAKETEQTQMSVQEVRIVLKLGCLPFRWENRLVQGLVNLIPELCLLFAQISSF